MEAREHTVHMGQEVVIYSPGVVDRYHGRRGVVEHVDNHTSLNVRVRFPEGSNWFSEGELVPAAVTVPGAGCGCN